MKRKQSKNKNLNDNNELIENNSSKIKDLLISAIQYGIGIIVLMSLFTWFKYPWTWIDQLYETENERLEKIDNDWGSAYTQLINWCKSETIEDKNSINNYNFKNNIISASGDFRKCLTDSIFRIELINNPKFIIEKNELLIDNFNNIPEHLKNFELNLENKNNYKKEIHFITTNYFFLRDDDLSSLREIEMDDDLFLDRQILCSYEDNFYKYDWSTRCSKYNLDETGLNELRKMFFLGFFSHEQFYLVSKGCYLGCFAELTFFNDGSENYIRGIKLISPKQYSWPKFTNKNHEKIQSYESIIYQLQYDVEKLKKENEIPQWLKHIDIGLDLNT